MKVFIPKAFTGEEDTCPVCVARIQYEQAQSDLGSDLRKLGLKAASAGLPAGLAAQYLDASEKFAEMNAHYQVALGVNLSIWFSAERFGRVKKVPDLILAYEEYKDKSLQSLASCSVAFETLISGFSSDNAHAESCKEELQELQDSLQLFVLKADVFWKVVGNWTDHRKGEAFKVI